MYDAQFKELVAAGEGKGKATMPYWLAPLKKIGL